MKRMLPNAIWILALFTACGSDSLTLKQAIIDREEVVCREVFRCSAEFGFPEIFELTFGATEADCNALAAAEAARYEIALKNGTLSYASGAFQTCIDKLEDFLSAQTCDVFWPNVATTQSPPECDRAVTGNVADGSSCTLDDECANDASECIGMKCGELSDEPAFAPNQGTMYDAIRQ